jgi:hypothetical protein
MADRAGQNMGVYPETTQSCFTFFEDILYDSCILLFISCSKEQGIYGMYQKLLGAAGQRLLLWVRV